MNADAPRVARSGRSFDWRGRRWRCEAGHGDPVEVDVAWLVDAINRKLEQEGTSCES